MTSNVINCLFKTLFLLLFKNVVGPISNILGMILLVLFCDSNILFLEITVKRVGKIFLLRAVFVWH